jgi:hypothetical protein
MAEAAAPPEVTTPRIKIKRPRQRACDEKDAKGKACLGHLKRCYDYPPDVAHLVGRNAELYRCERCKTYYQPDSSELARSYVHRY